MIISTLESFNYTTMNEYFNKLCDSVEATTDFTTIFRGDNVYQSINYGLKAVYKLNSTANRYLHIMSNNAQSLPYLAQSSNVDNNPALVNVSFMCCYVSPFYVAAGNPAGNYQSAGVTGAINQSGSNHISCLETQGSSTCYLLKNSGSIHMISFFKQKLYSQIMLKYNKATGMIAMTGTGNGNTYNTPFPDRSRKGLLFHANTFFTQTAGRSDKMSTFITANGDYASNNIIQDLQYDFDIGLLYNSDRILKLTNYTTNLAITAPIIPYNGAYIFDDIHYIQMKNLKQRETFLVGELEFIAFPVDSIEDPMARGYVLGYCFRTK